MTKEELIDKLNTIEGNPRVAIKVWHYTCGFYWEDPEVMIDKDDQTQTEALSLGTIDQ